MLARLIDIILEYTVRAIARYAEEKYREKQLKDADDKILQQYQAAVAAGQATTREERRDLANRLLNRLP